MELKNRENWSSLDIGNNGTITFR